MAFVLLSLSVVRTVWGAGPADELLRLVPPEAGATLAIEDLSTHSREFCASPLAEGLKRLPAVQAWLASDRYKGFLAARNEIERALDVPVGTIRDRLLGDAVVLAMHTAPGEDPDQAHGLLLVRFRDRGLLDRLIERINIAEKEGGTLLSVDARRHRQTAYWVRNFAPGSKPTEYYTILSDNVFAWSNSESVLQGVVDRKAGAAGLADDPTFRKLRARLPEHSVASLFINPRYVERMMAADSRRKSPGEEHLSALLARNLSAVAYAGASLEWRDGFVVHTEEAIDASKLDEPLRRWADQPGGSTSSLLARVPTTALAIAATHVDFGAVYDLLIGLAGDADRTQISNGIEVLKGIFLGKDIRTELLPWLGPGILCYVDNLDRETKSEGRFPLVLVVRLGDDAGPKGVSAALDNGLRTLLAASALDPKRREARLRVESREARGVRMTALVGIRPVLAYAVEHGVLVCGTSAEAVAGYCSGGAQAKGGSRFERFRSAYFSGAETFAFVDLARVREVADAHRDLLARRIAARRGCTEQDAGRDLDQALGLVNLFEGAYFTSTIERDFSAVHRTLGLVARDQASTTTSPPTGR
jgi:hypothetical protein